MSTRVHIRWMTRRDMPDVLEIEHGSFAHPWQEEDFLRVLRQRNSIGMVAEVGTAVLGFMIYTLHRGEIELVTRFLLSGSHATSVAVEERKHVGCHQPATCM